MDEKTTLNPFKRNLNSKLKLILTQNPNSKPTSYVLLIINELFRPYDVKIFEDCEDEKEQESPVRKMLPL